MRIKTVITVQHNGVMFFRMDSSTCYWTDDLRMARQYSGKAKAKLVEAQEYILGFDDGIAPKHRGRVYLHINGDFTGFDDNKSIIWGDKEARTIKLMEVVFSLKPV